MLRVARTVPCTQAEGPGRRYALWVAGCSLACPGCCNPELFSEASGELRRVPDLAAEIIGAAKLHGLDGVTILGGEPLEQLEGLTDLCARVSGAGLGVIVFTGFRVEDLRTRAGFESLWSSLDTLVDGPFDARLPEPKSGGRRFLGSQNQRLLHRSSRYADADLWRGPNHAELQIDPEGNVSIHGFPTDVVQLRRRIGG